MADTPTIKEIRCEWADKCEEIASNAAAISELQSATDSDDQQISLSGNILTLEDGGTVDLSAFLDDTDTDDQTITAFSLSPAGILTLTIEDGNTVTVNLSALDTDTDDQTLSLAGTLLVIADGNTVDLAALNTDQQTLSTATAANGATSSITISNGNTVSIVHPPASTPTLNVVTEEIGYTPAHGHFAADGTTIYSHNMTATEISAGYYALTFPTAMPVPYAVTQGAYEDLANRDGRDVQVVPGTQTATGVDIQILTGDNGGTADAQVSEEFSIAIHQTISVVTGVTIS